MRRVLTATLALLVLPILAITTPGATMATPQDRSPDQIIEGDENWRGLWVDAFNEGIYNSDQVSELVEHAQELGVNALVVQIGRRFDCFCNDAAYPRTQAAIDPAPFDPLQEIIDQAHAAGIEVHAWINATTLWNMADPPADPEHAFNTNGPTASGADRWLNQREDGEEIINGTASYIDPANPAAVDYVVAGMQSVAANYDIDGINLDYIRYPDYNSDDFANDWGYTEVSLERFAANTGRTDRPEPDDEEFSDWRRDQVSNLVRKIYLGINEVDPSVRLSINAITYGFGPQSLGGWEESRPYANVMQDWSGWLDEGIIDTVTAMNYKRNFDPDQNQMFSEWTDFMAQLPTQRHLVNGPALYLNDVEDSVDQAQITVDAGLDGWMGYAYANPSQTVVADPATLDDERASLLEQLRAGPFADDVTVPEMTWKTDPTTGMVSGQVQVRGGAVADGVEVTFQRIGGDRTTTLTDGSGWFGVTELEPGRYRVQVTGEGYDATAPRSLLVEAGDVGDVTLTARER